MMTFLTIYHFRKIINSFLEIEIKALLGNYF